MSCQQVPTTPAFNPYPRSVQVGEFEVAIGGGIWVAIRAEYAIFQVIEGLGVATKADVMNKVVGPGISPMAVNFAIASSPAFFKIERAIYTLHGRPINADALVNARLRRAAETSRQSLEKLTLDLRMS